MLVDISNSVRHHAIMSVWFMVDENAQTFHIACTLYNVRICFQTNRKIDRKLSTWQVMWRLKWFLEIYSFISYNLIFEHIMLTVAICNCVKDCSLKYFTSDILDYSHTGKEYASGKFLGIQKLHNAYSQSQSFSLFSFFCIFWNVFFLLLLSNQR